VKDKRHELALERAAHGPAAGAQLALDYELLASRYRAAFEKYEDIQTTLAMEQNDAAGALLVVDPPALGGIAAVGLNRRQRQALA
jgi:hypothetical protein